MSRAVYRKWIIILVGCMALSSFLPAEAQYFHFDKRRKKLNFPFQIVKNLMVIPVMINGEGPFNFILDTGVGLLLITERSLVDSLNIKTERSIRIAGLGEGSDLNASISAPLDLNLTSAVHGNMRAAVLDDDAFDLSGLTGMPVYGIIGYELFSSFIVRINYASSVITLYRSETAYIPRRGDKIPITIEENKPYIKGEVKLASGRKRTAKLIIDTGAGHPLSLETYEKVPFELPPEYISANLGVGISGEISGYIGRIFSLKLGRYELKNVITSFPDYSSAASKVIAVNRNGNIGNGILKRFNVVFDYNRGKLYLHPNPRFREPFEHDMSGIEFTSLGPDYSRILVTRIEKGSAAEEAGIIAGDEILSINFKPVNEMGNAEIDRMFRSQDGKSMVLELRMKGTGQKSHIVLTLKRRI